MSSSSEAGTTVMSGRTASIYLDRSLLPRPQSLASPEEGTGAADLVEETQGCCFRGPVVLPSIKVKMTWGPLLSHLGSCSN